MCVYHFCVTPFFFFFFFSLFGLEVCGRGRLETLQAHVARWGTYPRRTLVFCWEVSPDVTPLFGRIPIGGILSGVAKRASRRREEDKDLYGKAVSLCEAKTAPQDQGGPPSAARA